MKKIFYTIIFTILFFYFYSCNNSCKEKIKKNNYLQTQFNDPIYSLQFIRRIGYTTSESADIGECLYTAEQITQENNKYWHMEWLKTAKRIYSFAEKSLSKNYLNTAKEAFFRSSNYFLASEFFLPKGEKKLEIFKKAREAFKKASSLCKFPFKEINIPYENRYLPGYIYLKKSSTPNKTIILNTGYDGCAEELYFAIGYFAKKRDYNIIIFEGPGQGLNIRKDNLIFRYDWEKVIKAVVDFTLSFNEVDPKRLALYGRSFGGYLTPRAAAYEKRIKALIVNSPINDFSKVMKKQGLPIDLAKEDPNIFDKEIYKAMKKSENLNFFISEAMWKLGGKTPSEWFKNLEKYKLKNEASIIKCPTLVIASDEDHLVDKQQAKIFYNKLKCPKKLIIFSKETGAALHCQFGACFYSNEIIFDWLDNIFKK